MARPTRLWLCEHIRDLFAKKTGMEAIEGIKLDHFSPELKFSCAPFRHMEKLRLLHVYGKRDFGFCQGPEYLPNELRWISWGGYPSKYLPESFPAEKLVCLEMPGSDIVQLWKGRKRLDLSYCNLLEIPSDLSPLSSLEELNLSGNKFSSLPSNLGHLSRLKILKLEGCTELESLRDLPPSISVLVADDCQSLNSLMDLSSTKHEWLWYVSFANCFKLAQENQLGSSSTSVADMLLESLLQVAVYIHIIFAMHISTHILTYI
ncbi:hypothetical protein LguiB_010352 [Lonicera macranthoides]